MQEEISADGDTQDESGGYRPTTNGNVQTPCRRREYRPLGTPVPPGGADLLSRQGERSGCRGGRQVPQLGDDRAQALQLAGAGGASAQVLLQSPAFLRRGAVIQISREVSLAYRVSATLHKAEHSILQRRIAAAIPSNSMTKPARQKFPLLQQESPQAGSTSA
jgi:hypothetical protein